MNYKKLFIKGLGHMVITAIIALPLYVVFGILMASVPTLAGLLYILMLIPVLVVSGWAVEFVDKNRMFNKS